MRLPNECLSLPDDEMIIERMTRSNIIEHSDHLSCNSVIDLL